MFAALLVGLLVALAGGAPEVPEPAFGVAQAVAGVVIGAYLHSSTLTALGWDWVPVVLVSLATLAVTTGAGVAIGRFTAIDEVTASLGTIAGGASGIVAMARDLGGDDRLVAFMQYLRVLVVVLITPLLAQLAFGAQSNGTVTGNQALLGPAGGWLLVLVVAPLGVLAGRAVRLPAGNLLGPLILASIVSVAGLTTEIPRVLSDGAFALIGLTIGLRFTAEQVRAAGRLLPAVGASIVLLLAACFALGELLSAVTGVSALDGYLATTPGGLYAVLPIAFGSGADTAFVLAVQALRVFVSILLAPVVVRALLRRSAVGAGGGGQARGA